MLKLFCYMATPGGMTGAPRRLLTLCGILRKNGCDAQIISFADSQLLSAAKREGIPTRTTHLQSLLKLRHGALLGGGFFFRLRVMGALLIQNLRFACFVRRTKADVIWIRGAKGIVFAGLGTWLACRPIIWDVDYEVPSKGIAKWLHLLGLIIGHTIIFQYEGADENIFGVSRARMYKNKMHYLIPGIALERLDEFRRNRLMQPRHRLFTILQVGTICDRKNQMLTIQALGEVLNRERIPSFRVQFAGGVYEREYEKALITEISKLGLESQTEFLEWRQDVHQLMSEADLLVMPSKDEGIPNALQEAMYIGLPVIVSNKGGMPSVVDHDKTGWILKIDDSSRWAEQMIACIKNIEKCRAVGEAASRYAEAHFSKAEWGARYAEIVKMAASKKR